MSTAKNMMAESAKLWPTDCNSEDGRNWSVPHSGVRPCATIRQAQQMHMKPTESDQPRVVLRSNSRAAKHTNSCGTAIHHQGLADLEGTETPTTWRN